MVETRFLLAKAKGYISTGNSEALRLLLNACCTEERERLLLYQFDYELVLNRPGSSLKFFVHHPNLLVCTLAGWYTDTTECLCSYGVGIEQHFDVWDTASYPSSGQSKPLVIASMLGKVEMVKSLVNNGADLEATNSMGDTSLLEACYEGNYAVTEFLVQKRASVNRQNERGLTGDSLESRHLLSCNSSIVIVAYLLVCLSLSNKKRLEKKEEKREQ